MVRPIHDNKMRSCRHSAKRFNSAVNKRLSMNFGFKTWGGGERFSSWAEIVKTVHTQIHKELCFRS